MLIQEGGSILSRPFPFWALRLHKRLLCEQTTLEKTMLKTFIVVALSAGMLTLPLAFAQTNTNGTGTNSGNTGTTSSSGQKAGQSAGQKAGQKATQSAGQK